MSNSRECADYFKSRKEYDRCMEALLRKWKTYGRAAGYVTLDGATEEECRAIGGILGKSFPEGRIRFSVPAFEQGLQKTRFAPIGLTELLKAYFGDGIATNKETRMDAEDQKNAFFRQLCDEMRTRYGDGSPADRWMRDLTEGKANGYQALAREYSRDADQARQLADNVGNALEELERMEDECPLAVFAARITGNPHYFDRGGMAAQLLTYAICHMENTEFPSNAHDWRALWNSTGIVPDQISSMVHVYGVRFKTKSGWHPAYEAFHAGEETFAVTMANLSGITEAYARRDAVYVVENEMVFSYLADQCKSAEASILCTSGQLRSAALEIIGMLLESGHRVYYSGDTDPDGIGIADRLWRKFGDGIRIWRMSPEDYQNSLSQESVSKTGLAKLEGIRHPTLRETARLMRQRRRAGYQENILENLKNDILRGITC